LISLCNRLMRCVFLKQYIICYFFTNRGYVFFYFVILLKVVSARHPQLGQPDAVDDLLMFEYGYYNEPVQDFTINLGSSDLPR
jgi:hypothetical protein